MNVADLENEVARLRGHNMALQRRLEAARRDALLYAASLCEDHAMAWIEDEGWTLLPVSGVERDHGGRAYAAKLREIAK
jgi:hypothetical protein